MSRPLTSKLPPTKSKQQSVNKNLTLALAIFLLSASMMSLPYNVVIVYAAVVMFAAMSGWNTAFVTATDSNSNNTKNLQGLTANGEDVYRLAPRDISDAQLDAFFIDPILKRPGRRKMSVPAELSSDPNDDSWVFEGYLYRPPKDKIATVDSKKRSMREYFARLTDSERVKLEERLHARRIAKARKSAIARRVAFDERKEVAIALKDGEVWSLRAPSNDTSKSSHAARKGFVGNTTLVDNKGDELRHHERSDAGLGLELKSGYNGYDMKSYPWRAMGCLSASTSSSGCFGSGTKISARLVLTCGHCLSQKGNAEWSNDVVYWIPGADGVDNVVNGRDAMPNGVRVASNMLVSPEYFYNGNEDHDYGLIVLTPEKDNCDLGWFGYTNAASLLNVDVNVFGYPGGTCEASPVSSGSCSKSIYGDTEKVKSETPTAIGYDIDTQGGMSGCGVYLKTDEERYVVGVHVLGGGLDGAATRINDDVFSFIENARNEYPDDSAC